MKRPLTPAARLEIQHEIDTLRKARGKVMEDTTTEFNRITRQRAELLISLNAIVNRELKTTGKINARIQRLAAKLGPLSY